MKTLVRKELSLHLIRYVYTPTAFRGWILSTEALNVKIHLVSSYIKSLGSEKMVGSFQRDFRTNI